MPRESQCASVEGKYHSARVGKKTEILKNPIESVFFSNPPVFSVFFLKPVFFQ